ncbi:MAG TPA: FAD-binding oxidoreductase [Steroidobacteraceae bacterium]|nr:FAD-binding oxidoreductase [Steroidobacteraceae bacterium]
MSAAPIDVASLDGGSTTLAAAALHALGDQLTGKMIGAGDAGWHESIQLWNGMAARTPALVLECASVMDVAAVVRFASKHRLLLSIKGGGHHIAGTAIAERSLMLDIARLREITVDPSARLAAVGAGCRLQDVDAATQQHGLATVLGFVSEVGVAGLTLGGGLGYLTRRFGWTVDNLEAVEIVTADGEVRTASRTEHSDLFWALRGGGGNFGVVTRFVFRLHEVGPDVLGGLIAWPFERAAEILDAYRKITSSAPPELAVWLMLLRGPAAPFVPPTWHGKRLCALCVCYTGALARVDEVLAPIRALRDPVFDLLQVQPYTQVQSYLDATEPKGMHYYWKTEYLADLSAACLANLAASFAECPAPDADLGVLHLGGALNTRAPDDGAVGNRTARFVCGIKGMWAPDERNADTYKQWVRDAWQRLRPYSTGATYINFQTDDEDESRIRATYGPNLSRLQAVKRKYDPYNLFRVNRNIRPEP